MHVCVMEGVCVRDGGCARESVYVSDGEGVLMRQGVYHGKYE